jgi:hypothetical protein
MLRWSIAFGWLQGIGNKLRPRRKPRPARKWMRPVHLQLEILEDRKLFTNNAWLPLNPQPFDGISAANPAQQLLQPTTTSLLPTLGINSGTLSVSGNFSLTDTGGYSLTLSESGPAGNGDNFQFQASGPVTFSLTEQGTFSQNGYSTNSVVLTQTGTLAWSFLQTDGSGNTVQYLSGTNALTTTSNGGAPFDPAFWTGFNWLPLLQQISSQNNLGLGSLSASNVTVSETNGSDNYAWQQTGGLATVQGNVQQPLGDVLGQTGQQTATQTAVEQFSSSNQGNDGFSLTALGSFANGSYALGSVAYQETGSQTLGFNATVANAPSGQGAESGMQSFSGHNQVLGDAAGESFDFTSRNTLVYGEKSSGTYSLFQSGSYGNGSFNLGCLNYNAQGTGAESLTQTALQTQTGTFSQSGNVSGTDSYGVAGTLGSSGTTTQQGGFTATLSSTAQESQSGGFTLNELGGYGNGSWGLNCINLSEVLSGTFSQQQVGTTTQTGVSTTTQTGSISDSYALLYVSVSTTSASGSSTASSTQTGTITLTSTSSATAAGSCGYTLSLLGAQQNGSISLSSYVLSTSQNGVTTSVLQSTQTSSGSGQDSVSGSGNGAANSSYGGVTSAAPSSGSFTGSDSFSYASSNSQTTTDVSTVSVSVYLAGCYANGSYALSSVAYNAAGQDSWSSGGNDTSNDQGNGTSNDSGNVQGNSTASYGGDSFTDLNSETYTDSSTDSGSDGSTDTTSASGASQWTLTQLGSYGNFSFSFGSLLYQANGSSTSTTILGGNSTAQDNTTSTFNDSGVNSDSGTLPLSGNDGTFGLSSDNGLGTATDTSQLSNNGTSTNSLSETLVQTDSWNLYQAGLFQGGSYSLSSVSYTDVQTTSWTLVQVSGSTGTGGNSVSAGNVLVARPNYALGGLGCSSSSNGTSTSTSLQTALTWSTATTTEIGTSGSTLSEYGVFGAGSFSYASFVYQWQNSASGTIQTSSGSSFVVSGTDSSSNGLGQNSNNSQALLVLSGTNTGTLQVQDTYSESGVQSSVMTTTYTSSASQYQAGCYSAGSHAFSSAVFSSQGSDSWSQQQAGWMVGTSSDSWTSLYSGPRKLDHRLSY